MKTFKFSLVLRTRENTDVFITLDDNIYGIHRKRVNILYLLDITLTLFGDVVCKYNSNTVELQWLEHLLDHASRKHAYISLTPLNPTFI